MRALSCFLPLMIAALLPSAADAQKFLGKSCDSWKSELEFSKDEKARRNAAFVLGKLGSDAVAAIPALARAVASDDSPKVREASAFALGEIGGRSLAAAGSDEIVPVLQRALKDLDPLVRRSAAFALGNLGPSAAPAREALEEAIRDDAPGVRQNAAWAIGKLGPAAVPALRKALADQDAVVKRDAANAMIPIAKEQPKEAYKALSELLKLCQEKDSEVRKSALAVLVHIVGPEDAAAAAALRPALLDSDFEIRCNAALVLGNIGGKEARAAADVLVAALKKGSLDQRRQAAVALSRLGPEARPVVPELIKALEDPDAETRSNTALALGEILQAPDRSKGKDETENQRKERSVAADAAVPALAALGANPKEVADIRIKAIVALARMGDVPEGVKAMPKLLTVLTDSGDDPSVRERVPWTLHGHLGMRSDGVVVLRNRIDGALQALTQVVKEERRPGTRMLRYHCAYLLSLLQRSDVPVTVLDVLSEFLRDEEIKLYQGVDTRVSGAGSETGSGKAKVEEVAADDGRVMAVRALRSIGRERVVQRKDIVEQLRNLVAATNTHPDLKSEAQKLLQTIGR